MHQAVCTAAAVAAAAILTFLYFLSNLYFSSFAHKKEEKTELSNMSLYFSTIQSTRS